MASPTSNIVPAESRKPATSNHKLELERQLQRRKLLRKKLSLRLGEVGSCLLEPGCGHGHWLTAYAAQYPNTICVGLDLLRERIEKARSKAARAGLEHVHFIKAELLECIECLPAGLKLQNIVFLFPDPWPKKRHHRRRMIQMDSLSALAERSMDDAKLYFRSDDSDYVEWTRELVCAHPDWQLDETLPWLFEQETLFQRKMLSYQSLQARRIVKE